MTIKLSFAAPFLTKRDRLALLGLFFVSMLLVTQLCPWLVKSAEAAGVPDSYYIKGVPLYTQIHNLSCEYASAKMVTDYYGNMIPESQFVAAIPLRDNPHFGFRGNIDAGGGGLTNDGIYAEPLANYISRLGFKAEAWYGSVEALKYEVSHGQPVIVWVTIAMQYATPVRYIEDGSPVKLVPGEHTVVVTGYDRGGVYVNGPSQGIRAYFDWDDFIRTWDYFDNMALSIWT